MADAPVKLTVAPAPPDPLIVPEMLKVCSVELKLAVALALLAGGAEMATSTRGDTIPTLGISEAIRYAPVMIAGVLITLFSIEHLIALFSGKEVVPSWH